MQTKAVQSSEVQNRPVDNCEMNYRTVQCSAADGSVSKVLTVQRSAIYGNVLQNSAIQCNRW